MTLEPGDFTGNLRRLRRLAGSAAYQRGEAYEAVGKVRDLAETKDRITGTVHGARPYRVELGLGSKEPRYSCTCPVGHDGAFCKHCVALGLAWLHGGLGTEPLPIHTSGAGEPAVRPADLRAYLGGLRPGQLVDLLMEQAGKDDRLWRRLAMAAAKGSTNLNLATFRRAIDDAIGDQDFMPYAEAEGYAQGISEVVDAIQGLLREGYAAEVVKLTEHALKAVERAIGSVDDSDGHLGDILDRLQELHLAACRKARPGPKTLARRLFQWELGSEWDVFAGAAERYARVLGKEGLAEYRRLAEAQWARVRPLGPGVADPDRYGSGRRFRITAIMEALARQAGDLEALVAVKQRDLTSPYGFLQIADLYRQERKYDLALEWAERGHRAFPDRPDPRLTAFLADEYHRRQRHDEALALIWAEFDARPWLEQAKSLKRHADRVGRWPEWRDRAVARMRDQLAQSGPPRSSPYGWPAEADHSELVRFFLWDGDLEAAWREAHEGGCSRELWLELAALGEASRPEEALAVWRQQVGPAVARTTNEAYREAVGLLRKVRGLMARLGRGGEFGPYLESVRAEYKRKRNFVQMLDRAKWS